MQKRIKVEVCCGSLSDVLTAARFPMDRIELNSALELGGLTPGMGTFCLAKKNCSVPIMVMVRPRPAGFSYNQAEIDTMFAEAEAFLKEGADGIVFGFLNPDHTVDEASSEKMVHLIHQYGKTAVFHRAVDQTKDYLSALKAICRLQCDRVLTSGHAQDALTGAENIRMALEASNGALEILAGCGISSANVKQVIQKSGVKQIHLSASTIYHDQGEYKGVSAANLNALFAVLNQREDCYLAKKDEIPSADLEMMQNDPYEAEMGGH